MRLHFQERPWDLYVSVGYTIAMAGVLLVLEVGNLLAFLLVLFVPGYVLIAALFPSSPGSQKAGIGWIERLALSLGLSIAVVPLLGLLLNITPFGIRFAPMVVTVVLFTIGTGSVAIWRRVRLPANRRLSMTLEVSLSVWREYSALDKVLTVALASGIVAAGVTMAYIVDSPRPITTFTAFYILGPAGNASGYPTNLIVNETGNLVLGVVNREGATVNYTIRIDLARVQIVYNVSEGFNQPVEVNRTTWSVFNVALADGLNWTQPYPFRINQTGLWKLQFLLFKDGAFSSAYRELHLYIRVT